MDYRISGLIRAGREEFQLIVWIQVSALRTFCTIIAPV